MLPRTPFLKTPLLYYAFGPHGGVSIRAHRGSPAWVLDREPTRAEVIMDLRAFAENPDNSEAEKAMARLFEGAYRLERIGNGEDICGHHVTVTILPQVNDRWQEMLPQAPADTPQ